MSRRLDDEISEAGACGNRDLGVLDLFLAVFCEEFFVGVDARLAFCVPAFRAHADPFELAVELLAAVGLSLFLEGEALRFLVEPARVVALPGNALAAVEFENPFRDVVEEIAVMGNGDDGAGVLLEMALEPGDGLGVEMVRRLVEEENVGFLEEKAAKGYAAALASRENVDDLVGGRAAEGFHREFELAVELPGVACVEFFLHLRLSVEKLVHVGIGISPNASLIASNSARRSVTSFTPSDTTSLTVLPALRWGSCWRKPIE